MFLRLKSFRTEFRLSLVYKKNLNISFVCSLGRNGMWSYMRYLWIIWSCLLISECKKLLKTGIWDSLKSPKNIGRRYYALVSRSISNRVCDSLNWRCFFAWTFASVRKSVDEIRHMTAPTTPKPNDQPETWEYILNLIL